MAVKGMSAGGNVLMVVGLQMLVGSIALWIPALALEEWVFDWKPQVIAAFLYTIFVPGIAATFIWFWLVGRIGAVRAATFHFLNPFFGVMIAALLLSEALGILDLIGVTIITIGIFDT